MKSVAPVEPFPTLLASRSRLQTPSVPTILVVCFALSLTAGSHASPVEPPTPTSGCLVSLDFDQDGVLPSSQGMSYAGNVPETSVFSVQSGLLHIDTVPFGGGAFAVYLIANAYDPSKDAILEFRMKVFAPTGAFGIDFEFSDNVLDYEFGFATDHLRLPPPPPSRPIFPFNPTDHFHTYKVFAPGGSASYQLFIDGSLVHSDTVVPPGDPGQRFIFGDGTGGNVGLADVDFVRFCQRIAAQIDIKPGSDPNSINLGASGVIPVAILSSTSPAFNAPLEVDPASVSLAGASVKMVGKANKFLCSSEDVNSDGLDDLVCHVETAQFMIEPGDSTAVLEAKTFGGIPIRGEDSVRIVPD